MPAHAPRAAVLAAVLLGPVLFADYTYPPQPHGDGEATLTVRAADRTAVQGQGEVTLLVTVNGPATLEVEEPHLSDALAAWKEERLPYIRTVENQRATWSQTIRLKQIKPGVAPPPDVAVRFRGGPEEEWEEARWIDILKHLRDVPPPEAPPTETSWPRRWGPILVSAFVSVLLLMAWITRRRRAPTPPLPPEQQALREVERIEQALLPPRGDAESFHTQLSHVVRRYLAERFGLHALEQTTSEFLDAVRQVHETPAELQALLREFLERCDLAKFARASTPPEECRQSAELAREMIRRTTPTNSERQEKPPRSVFGREIHPENTNHENTKEREHE